MPPQRRRDGTPEEAGPGLRPGPGGRAAGNAAALPAATPAPARARPAAAPPAPDAARPRPRVTVLTTTRNAMPHLLEAVASVQAQTMPDWELLVVDDGSTDGTREAVRDAAAEDPRIRLLETPPLGRIPCLNAGAQAARAGIIAILDADDVALRHRLQRTLDAFGPRPRLGLLGSAIVPRIGPAGEDLGIVRRPTEPGQVLRALARDTPFFHSSTAFRIEAWRDVGGYDESLPLYEDYDLFVRLAARWEIENLPEPLSLKRRHPGQAFHERHFTRQAFRARSRIHWRYFRHVRKSPEALARAAAFLIMPVWVKRWVDARQGGAGPSK